MVNISSAIVHARPDSIAAVRAALCAMDGIEIHAASDDGKLIVTIECADDRATANTFESIGQVVGVLSVAMVYHQAETDPEMAISAES